MEKGRVSLSLSVYGEEERNENSFNLENRVLPVSLVCRDPRLSLLATLLAPSSFSSGGPGRINRGRRKGGGKDRRERGGW